MGAAAVAYRRAFRHLGYAGDIFAGEVAPAYRSLVKPASSLRVGRNDWVVYHHGIASSLAGELLHLPARRAVVFHNITPARYYSGTRLSEALTGGRAQLVSLAAGTELAIGVSELNAQELRSAGHRNVHVVPLFVEPERFAPSCADESLLARLKGKGPLVVSVSRVVPHKRVDDLLALHAELRRAEPEARLLIVGGYAPGNDAFRRLLRTANRLGGVTWLGSVTHAQLVAAYRSADVYVSMSEHEGFGVPLIEAMATEVPVVAFGAGAVAQTMGGAGVVFDEKNHAVLAQLVMELSRPSRLRSRLLSGQRRRVRELSFASMVRALEVAWPKEREALSRRRPKSSRPRVAVVVQRYGKEVTGGAEAHARMVAQRLAKKADVTVLTTCAKEHLTWANEFAPGVSREGAVRIERFAVEQPRAMVPFNALSKSLFGRPLDAVSEEHWVAEQGPRAPRLLEAIADRRDAFDAFIFFTYLYAPTVWGVPLVGPKALVVPTAHDEPALHFGLFSDVFEQPSALLVNSFEERELIARRFPKAARARVVGVGVEPLPANPARFAKKHGIERPSLLSVGRLEEGKGVGELLFYHRALWKAFHDAPVLVLAGAGDMRLGGPGVVAVGRISEEEKFDALAGALAVAVPSRFESLSLVTLEAFSVGTPVLGHAACDVVAGHVRRSHAGRTYDDAASFADGVKALGLTRDSSRKPALAYARKFRWDVVMKAYFDEIERLR